MTVFRRVAFRVVLLILVLSASSLRAEEFSFFHENVLGTSLEVRVNGETAENASTAEQAILEEIDRLTRVLSTYQSDSEISRWMNGTKDVVSFDLYQVLESSDRYEHLTQGTFNPRAAMALSFWKQAAKSQELPTEAELQLISRQMAQPVWTLNSATKSARYVGGPQTRISLDAIAKGFIVDQACQKGLAVNGIHGVLVNIGGDLRAAGAMTRNISIATPGDFGRSVEVIALTNQSLATSGNAYHYVEIQGRRYSHIIVPQTARPAAYSQSVSVLAETATEADALATALSAMSVEEALRFADQRSEIACLIVGNDGKVTRSSRWPESLLAADDKKPVTEAKADDWPKGAKMNVAFEINNPGGGARYRRPYVAVWVEDKDGFPVRTLVLWVQEGRGSRWYRDLRRWYKQDELRQVVDPRQLIGSISAATHAPGKYKASWDGKDDLGNLVEQGEYTLYFEAAREHGTYQLSSTKVTIGKDKQEGKLDDNEEIKSATFEYIP